MVDLFTLAFLGMMSKNIESCDSRNSREDVDREEQQRIARKNEDFNNFQASLIFRPNGVVVRNS